MPRYKRKRRVYGKRNRGRYRRRRKTPVGKRVRMRRSAPTNFLRPTYHVKHRYYTEFQLNAEVFSTNGVATRAFRLNNLFDPDRNINIGSDEYINHSVMGYDQLSLYYSRYMVYKADYYLYEHNRASTSNTGLLGLVVTNDPDQIEGMFSARIIEDGHPFSTDNHRAAASSGTKKLRGHWSLRRHAKLKGPLSSFDTYRTNVGAESVIGDAKNNYFLVVWQSGTIGNADPVNTSYSLIVVYHAVWSDPTRLVQSGVTKDD